MKYLNVLFLLVALGLFSCKSKDNADGDNPKNAKKGATKEAVIESQISTDLASVDSGDKFTMDNVRIEGNFMYVDVTYSGGCQSHTFSLIGSAAIAKSLPPIRKIKLTHQGHEDHCRALISQTLTIDISNLAYKKEPGSQIYFELEGYKGRITYTFKK